MEQQIVFEKKKNQVVLDSRSFFALQQKAAFLAGILDFIEDKALGYLMKETENEENISLKEAKKIARGF
ncbi:MAG: hypothetical protein M1127_03370 [Patescibacteria group bacterium]|nr:hypothetical protein [Patescibacteria group bacterium]